MNKWISKPTDPGLYLYKSDREKSMPLEFDGEHFWIRLPEGSRPSGQRAIMFRPGGGVFWRIPDPPPTWERGLAGIMNIPAPLFSGTMHDGATFEALLMSPQPPRPMMPLIRVEETASVLDSHMPITGRWGWGKNTPECPPAMFQPFRCIDAMKDPITDKIEERAHAFDQDPDILYPSAICKCGFHKTHRIHVSAPDAT